MKNFWKKTDFLVEQLLGVMGIVAILIITANVICRFVLKISMSWSDEFLRTLLVYGYFIGAAVMFCHNDIMRLELLDGAAKKKPAVYKVLQIVLSVINALFFGIMTYYVAQIILQYVRAGTTTSTSSTPAWVLPLGFAIGSVTITIAAVLQLVKAATGKTDA